MSAIDTSIDLHVHYSVNCKIRHGIPADFKIQDRLGNEIFRTGVVFFRRDADGEFYGPFVTGKDYDAFAVKELLDNQNIYVFSAA